MSTKLGAIQFTRWDAKGYLAKSFGNHTFNFNMKLDDKLGSDPLPRYEYFQWGGFL